MVVLMMMMMIHMGECTAIIDSPSDDNQPELSDILSLHVSSF
jgi:hypothetical protein